MAALGTGGHSQPAGVAAVGGADIETRVIGNISGDRKSPVVAHGKGGGRGQGRQGGGRGVDGQFIGSQLNHGVAAVNFQGRLADDAAADGDGIAVDRGPARTGLMAALGRRQGKAASVPAVSGADIDAVAVGNIGGQGKGLVVAHSKGGRGEGGKAAGGFGDRYGGGSRSHYRAAGIAFPQLRRYRPALSRYRLAGYLAGVQGQAQGLLLAQRGKTPGRDGMAQVVVADGAVAGKESNGVGLIQRQVGQGYAVSVPVSGDVGTGQAGDGDGRVGKLIARRPIAPNPADVAVVLFATPPPGAVPRTRARAKVYRRAAGPFGGLEKPSVGCQLQFIQLNLVAVRQQGTRIAHQQSPGAAGHGADAQAGGRRQGGEGSRAAHGHAVARQLGSCAAPVELDGGRPLSAAPNNNAVALAVGLLAVGGSGTGTAAAGSPADPGGDESHPAGIAAVVNSNVHPGGGRQSGGQGKGRVLVDGKGRRRGGCRAGKQAGRGLGRNRYIVNPQQDVGALLVKTQFEPAGRTALQRDALVREKVRPVIAGGGAAGVDGQLVIIHLDPDALRLGQVGSDGNAGAGPLLDGS